VGDGSGKVKASKKETDSSKETGPPFSTGSLPWKSFQAVQKKTILTRKVSSARTISPLEVTFRRRRREGFCPVGEEREGDVDIKQL
jgi:hypothetical protein